MCSIRGVNVFPSQIESVLLGVEEASAHYMIVVDRVNSQDKLTVQVELKEDVDMGDAAKLAAIASRIKTNIKQTLLISAKVELVPPKTIPRSEGKAKRITDNKSNDEQNSNYRSDSKTAADEQVTDLINAQGYNIGKQCLISDCSKKPFGIVHLTFDCTHCCEARCAQKVEYQERISCYRR